MQTTLQSTGPTNFTLTMIADSELLESTKQRVLREMGKNLSLHGFRSGKAPLAMIERSVDQNQLQTEFLERAVNELYVAAISQEKLLPASQPKIEITKFVPYYTLEVKAEIKAVGKITLADYKTVAVTRPVVKVSDEQVEDTIKNLLSRQASREPVTRAAKLDDEVVIDFAGTDAKTKESIAGADGKDYALILGSGSFIPGFEDELVGLKAQATKEFTITFPADYGVADLQKKKVTFNVTVQKVQKVVQPKLDAAFAASVGPFKSVQELRDDIRRELENQANQEAERQFDNDIVQAITDKSTVAIPTQLIDDELERLEQQERQNIVYRGQTWQEHLDAEGVTDDEHKAKNRPGAENRVKAGLLLGEIAEKEQITVSPEELEIRLQLLKGRYASDQKMQVELDKPENRRDLMSRLLTEKTLERLRSFVKQL